MSGDVQPRKRREKKKKKEDAAEEVVFQHQHQTTATSPSVTEDLNIHIQKEAATGGGLCAKFVFFILLSVLIGLIGVIITEHRGLTDLDTVDTESHFAQLFEGWIDKPSTDHEDDEPSIEQSEENLYEEEDDSEEDQEEEQDESLDHDSEEENDEATDENPSDEEDDDVDDEEKEESDLQEDDTIENESDYLSNENDDENEYELEENEDEDEQDEDEREEDQEYGSEDEEKYEISSAERDESSLSTKEDVTQEDATAEDEEEEEYEEDQDDDESEQTMETTETEESIYRAEPEESVDLTESEEAADLTESEEARSLSDVGEDATEKADEDDTTERMDDDDTITTRDTESKETITKVHQEKRSEFENKKTTEETIKYSDQPQESENYNMVVKFGVGTALLVVAHVVLVQKWRTEKLSEKKPQDKPQDSSEEVETVTPDLSRRNTIVTPPSFQEIEQDIENIEEEYSEDEDDYDSEDDSRSKPARAKMRYQELQSTYSHSLTPNWEPKEIRENRNKNYEKEEEENEEECEGDEDYDDEISENEDEELLKRLEAKYGKIRQSDEEPDDDGDGVDDQQGDENDEIEGDDDDEELEDDRDENFDSWKRVKVSPNDVPGDTDSESEKDWSKSRSGAQSVYDFSNITNSDDWKIREELDQARQNLENDAAYALTLFNKILERNPSSPRALYGKAQSLDILAEQKMSNNLLQRAIATYQQTLAVPKIPDALFQITAERCVDRMRFRGLYGQAVTIHKLLINRFPKEVKFGNHLAVTYLTMNKIKEAKTILHQMLLKHPNDGFALVHYGFVLKMGDNNLEEAVNFLKKGIATKEPGVIDGRFYFHLGDALTRLGRNEEAMTVYLDGVTNKIFLSKYQRSLYNVERLTGKPWWKKNETPYTRFFEHLVNNWKTIRDEGLGILNKQGYFQPEAENLRDVGDWKQFELYARGIKNAKNCKQCPFTCKIVELLPDAVGCRRGQIKFSVMHPGTHVWSHCGPTNCRLRVHLGLKVPLNTYIRVGEEIRSWEEGKLLIFDDSFEHEVWHNGTATRLVLIVDVWHPELTKQEKQSLSSI